MPAAVVKIDLENLEPVKRMTLALMRLLHEVELCDPALLPDGVLQEAADCRAVIDEWRRPGRHARRSDRG
jgi:hypothetical protein